MNNGNKIDISIKYEDAFNCSEIMIVSVAKWLGYDYAMCFADNWNFCYDKNNSDLIGNNIKLIDNNAYDYLEKYHGLKTNYHKNINIKHTINSINAEIIKNMPVVICIDTFWCPFHYEKYQKVHTNHACLIVDIDEEGNYYAMDAQRASKGTFIPLYDIANGIVSFITFETVIHDKVQITINDFIDLHLSSKIEQYEDMFSQMTLFLYDIQYRLNLEEEIKGNENNPTISPLLKNIRKLGQSRKKFSLTLKYMQEDKKNSSNLILLSEKIQQIGDGWMAIYGMMCKAYYCKHKSDYIFKRIIEKVSDLIKEEAEVYQNICNIANINLVEPDKNIFEIDMKKTSKYTFIELESHLNSQGFAGGNPSETHAEISNGGRYMLSDNIKADILEVDDMKFKLNNILLEKNDNISCFGEVINLHIEGSNTYIMFLGCAEFGNHSDTIEIVYENNEKESVPIELSSWLVYPAFQEKIAFIGRGAVKSDNSYNIYPMEVHLYAKKYRISQQSAIKKIILPVCPNIHLFAVTLVEVE